MEELEKLNLIITELRDIIKIQEDKISDLESEYSDIVDQFNAKHKENECEREFIRNLKESLKQF